MNNAICLSQVVILHCAKVLDHNTSNRHNMAFLRQKHDSSLRGISWKYGISLDVVQGKLRAKLRKLDERRTKVTDLKKTICRWTAFCPAVLKILSKLMKLWTQKYHQILTHHVIQSEKCMTGNSFLFKHDNHPKLTVNAVKLQLGRKTHNETLWVMDWLPQSQDLNYWNSVGSSKRGQH